MDPTLTKDELEELRTALPAKELLEEVARKEVRRAYLADLRGHLERLTREIKKQYTFGYASIEVPEVWLPPLEQVLVHRGLEYYLKPPPQGTNMASVTVRWAVDQSLTQSPYSRAVPVPRKCDRHSQCKHMLHHRGACEE